MEQLAGEKRPSSPGSVPDASSKRHCSGPNASLSTSPSASPNAPDSPMVSPRQEQGLAEANISLGYDLEVEDPEFGFNRDYPEDDDSDSIDSCGNPRYKKDAPMTEKMPKPPKQSDVRCRCGSANAKKAPCGNCSCSKWGYPCSSSVCGCHDACQNPFNNLAHIFGTTDQPLKLHPCFVAWVLKLHPVLQRSLDVDWLFSEVLEGGGGTLEYEVKNCKKLASWKRSWEQAEGDPDMQEELKMKLLRLAFLDDKCEYYFSFCQGPVDSFGSWTNEDVSKPPTFSFSPFMTIADLSLYRMCGTVESAASVWSGGSGTVAIVTNVRTEQVCRVTGAAVSVRPTISPIRENRDCRND